MKVNAFGSMPQHFEATTIVAEPTVTVNDTQFFDFDKQKCQSLTLEQLSRTNRENRGTTIPPCTASITSLLSRNS